MSKRCNTCEGSGKLGFQREDCWICGGKGMITDDREIKVNLNMYAKIKLNDRGIEILKEDHNTQNALIKSIGAQGIGQFQLNLDEDGLYKIQLWRLMQLFGDHILLGTEVPFETNFKLIEL